MFRAAVKTARGVKHGVMWSVGAVILFVLVEAAIFRSGWYTRYIEPDSSAGIVEYQLYWLQHTPPANKPEVMVVGDSRMAEGFSALRANAEVQERINFWNFGIGGSTPRDWYYIVRDADPTRRRFAAIAIAIDNYSDEEADSDPRESIADLNYLIGRLRLSDCWDFAMSMDSVEYRETALAGCVFKGATLRRDVRELLRNVPARLRNVNAHREHGLEWISGYEGMQQNLRGLSIDPATSVIHYPTGLSDSQRDWIARRVNPRAPPDEGLITSYRRQWLGRIVDLYRNSPTRIVFFQIPLSPLAFHHSTVAPRFLESVSSRPRVTILPQARFRDLEQPELFADGLHLNRDGRKIFSERLALDVERVLATR